MNHLESLIHTLMGTPALIKGASKEELVDFVQRCERELSNLPPVGYLKLLEICNGAAENGVFLYSTRRMPYEDCAGATCDFIETNKNWRDLDWMDDYLIFADSDMDIYVYEISTGLFQVRDRQAFNNIYYEFSCFEEIAVYIFELMLAD